MVALNFKHIIIFESLAFCSCSDTSTVDSTLSTDYNSLVVDAQVKLGKLLQAYIHK